MRNASVVTDQLDDEFRTLTDTSEEVVIEDRFNLASFPPPPPPPPPPPAPPRPRPVHHGDPLAQTFKVDDPSGVFVTKCDIFFQSKSLNLPIAMEIRETTLGTP